MVEKCIEKEELRVRGLLRTIEALHKIKENMSVGQKSLREVEG